MLFYEPGKSEHGLPYDPFKACVVPRPIGWISSVDPKTGHHNLAPYSQFNNLTYDPPYVMFAANKSHTGKSKDSVANAEAAGCFGWSLATWDLREQVNATAEYLAPEVDEFEQAGLEKTWSKVLPVQTPLVARSPVRFECTYYTTVRLPGNPPMGTVDVVIGRVQAIHVEDWAMTDGKIDIRKTQPIARCGYYEYAVIKDTFEMVIPGMNEAMLAGLEGSVSRTRAFHQTREPEGKESIPGADDQK